MIDFNEFWNRYAISPEYLNRYYATRDLWEQRTEAAQRAMLDALTAGRTETKGRNPYFFVQDFPEPAPTNYNGRALPNEPVVTARYNGRWGTYTLREAQLFGLEIAAS